MPLLLFFFLLTLDKQMKAIIVTEIEIPTELKPYVELLALCWKYLDEHEREEVIVDICTKENINFPTPSNL